MRLRIKPWTSELYGTKHATLVPPSWPREENEITVTDSILITVLNESLKLKRGTERTSLLKHIDSLFASVVASTGRGNALIDGLKNSRGLRGN
jgi:hypothetical protein